MFSNAFSLIENIFYNILTCVRKYPLLIVPTHCELQVQAEHAILFYYFVKNVTCLYSQGCTLKVIRGSSLLDVALKK